MRKIVKWLEGIINYKVKNVSDPVQVLGRKLDDIIMKLEGMAEGITAMINEIHTTNEGLGENVKKLAETLENYTDKMTEGLKGDFDSSRSKISEVTREINSLTRVTGTDQIMRINQALNGLLGVLQQAINPNMIQAQLNEISQFIRMYGGQK